MKVCVSFTALSARPPLGGPLRVMHQAHAALDVLLPPEAAVAQQEGTLEKCSAASGITSH